MSAVPYPPLCSMRWRSFVCAFFLGAGVVGTYNFYKHYVPKNVTINRLRSKREKRRASTIIPR